MKIKLHKIIIIAVVIITTAIISVTGCLERAFVFFGLTRLPDSTDAVRFVDVGQGDCTLVQSDGAVMLIDTGDSGHAIALCNYIRSLGFEKIDRVIITHPHSDHLGGLETICKRMQVDLVYITTIPPSDLSDREAFDGFKESYPGEIVSLAEMDDFRFGGFEVNTVLFDEYAADENDRSAVISLRFGEYGFLVTGDISKNDVNINQSADVLKIAHHGSETGTSAKLLSAVKPEYAVISVGADNSYGHPSDEVLSRLKGSGVKIYRTDCNGTVSFLPGDGMKIITEY